MAQKVRIIPATINRTTSAPIAAQTKRKVAGYARVSTGLHILPLSLSRTLSPN